jgi:hypothetical protein
VADEIRITVCAFDLEISVVGRQPGVEYLRDGYPMVTKNQHAWRLLAAMACVALNTDAEQPLFRHRIHRTTFGTIVVLKALPFPHPGVEAEGIKDPVLIKRCSNCDHGRAPVPVARIDLKSIIIYFI